MFGRSKHAPAAALILDAHLKSALAAIRSLAKRGVRVIAGSDRTTGMGLHSAFAGQTFTYPSPLQNRDAFIERISSVAKHSPEPLVLYTFSDASFVPLFESLKMLGNVWAPLPSNKHAVGTAYNKAETTTFAKSIGVETPNTFHEIPDFSTPDFSAAAEHAVSGLLIKPQHSTTWRNDGGVRPAPQVAFSKPDAKARFDQIYQITGEAPLVQELIYGEELGAEFVCMEGEPIAEFAHRRIRSLTPMGGASVLGESVAKNYKQCCDIGRQLVRGLRWTGPVMVEFKIDNRDGRPKLIEVNGRFWGSLPLAIASGIDFPWAYYCLATGLAVPEFHEYRTGLTSRHLVGDCKHLKRVLFRDGRMPFEFPSRWSALRDFVSPFFAAHSDVWSLEDPLPAFVELVDGLIQGASAKYRVHMPGSRDTYLALSGRIDQRIEDAPVSIDHKPVRASASPAVRKSGA